MAGESLRHSHGVVAALVAAALAVACSRPPATADGRPHGSWDGALEIATGEAHRGPWQMNESDFRWVDDPAVMVSERGEIYVAWVDQTKKDLFVRRFGGEPLVVTGDPVNVSNSPTTFSWLPRIALCPKDRNRVSLLWQEIIFSGGSHGGDILFATSADGGQSFAAPVNLSESIAGDGKGRLSQTIWDNGSLDLASGSDGETYAVWTEYEGALWFRRSQAGLNQFAPAVRVSKPESEPARGPSLAVVGKALHIVWAVGERETADIWYASSSDEGGGFSAPKTVAGVGGHSDAPRIAVDHERTLHLVFANRATSDSRRFIHYSRFAQGAKGFDPARRLPTASGTSAHYPALAVDGRSNVYVLWEQYADPRARPSALGFTHSSNGGRSFQPSTSVPKVSGFLGAFNGSQQGLFGQKLATNTSGRTCVANSTFQPDVKSWVWLICRQTKPN